MNTYDTSDLITASFLYWKGFKLECVDKTLRRIVFSFSRETGMDEVLENFHRGHETVEPHSFYESIKTLKGRIHND